MISIIVIIKNTGDIFTRMGMQVLNICTKLLQYYYTLSGSQEKKKTNNILTSTRVGNYKVSEIFESV